MSKFSKISFALCIVSGLIMLYASETPYARSNHVFFFACLALIILIAALMVVIFIFNIKSNHSEQTDSDISAKIEQAEQNKGNGNE